MTQYYSSNRNPEGHARLQTGTQLIAPQADYDDVFYSRRMPSSTRRYQHQSDEQDYDIYMQSSESKSYTDTTGYRSIVPPRRTATQTFPPHYTTTSTNPPTGHRYQQPMRQKERQHEPLQTENPARVHIHWLFSAGLGMVAMLAVWVALMALINWWQITQDDWHYGRPRTYQTDAVVGHHDSATHPSHFVALNLDRHIEVIEFPGGDATRAKVYIGPILLGPGQDLTVVTLTFKDVNGDKKPDMILNIQGSHFIFLNDNGQFRPPQHG